MDLFALYFYKPMDRLQEAHADFAQQAMLLNAWLLATNLELLAMDARQPASIRLAGERILHEAEQAAAALQRLVEDPAAADVFQARGANAKP